MLSLRRLEPMLIDVRDARRLEDDSSLPRRELTGDRILVGVFAGEKRRGDITTTVAMFFDLPRGEEIGEIGEIRCLVSGKRESLTMIESRGTEERRCWLRREGRAGRRVEYSMVYMFSCILIYLIYIRSDPTCVLIVMRGGGRV
ncbi:hypothetical protein AA313_de0204593 [Arthrobotrys entomopaga]|nr:hypothetical protein AA313_de0204593 [Arthrobotrys entomopaga]